MSAPSIANVEALKKRETETCGCGDITSNKIPKRYTGIVVVRADSGEPDEFRHQQKIWIKSEVFPEPVEAWAKSKPFPLPEETWVNGSRGEGMKVQFCLSHSEKEVVHTWFETIGGAPDPEWRKGMFPEEK